MVNFYLKRIKNGQMTIDDVPARWKEEVEKALAEEIKSLVV